jgi:hypothetical protein
MIKKCFAPDCGPTDSSGWRHNYSTKTRQVGQANEQSMYSLMSMVATLARFGFIFGLLQLDIVHSRVIKDRLFLQ